MYQRQGSNSPSVKITAMFFLIIFIAPLQGQHGPHTHGKAELNLVLNTEHEIVAELITPANSVYGFEHTPRNAKEKEQMREGLKRLKTSLHNMLTFEIKASCTIAEIEEEGYAGVDNNSQRDGERQPGNRRNHEHHEHHEHHEQRVSTKGHHGHQGENHGSKKAHSHQDDHHSNVTMRWRVFCGADLTGQKMSVDWSKALPEIHRLDLTLLTPNRQDAIILRKSGAVIRL